MPNYGLHKYGQFKYGKYRLSYGGGGGSFKLGPHVRYRIRTIDPKGKTSDYLTLNKKRIGISSKGNVRTRIRADKGSWVLTQNATVQQDTVKVRIRSLESDGGMSHWVYSERGTLS